MKVLLLNQDYSPLNVTTLKRGFNLVLKSKAEIINYDATNPIKTGSKTFKRPTVIRLIRYVSLPYKKVKLSRQNIFKRDGFKCVYCGEKDNLTIDHLIPKSKGGDNRWGNLVTCCSRCNKLKDDLSVEDFLKKSGYKMSHKPYTPTYLQFIKEISKNINKDWEPFLIG